MVNQTALACPFRQPPAQRRSPRLSKKRDTTTAIVVTPSGTKSKRKKKNNATRKPTPKTQRKSRPPLPIPSCKLSWGAATSATKQGCIDAGTTVRAKSRLELRLTPSNYLFDDDNDDDAGERSVEVLHCREEMPSEEKLVAAMVGSRRNEDLRRRGKGQQAATVSADMLPICLSSAERQDSNTKMMRFGDGIAHPQSTLEPIAVDKTTPSRSTPPPPPPRSAPMTRSPVRFHTLDVRSPEEKEANEQEVLDFLGGILESPLRSKPFPPPSVDSGVLPNRMDAASFRPGDDNGVFMSSDFQYQFHQYV